MTDLKGSVSITYTINLGNYQSIKADAYREYDAAQSDAKTELAKLDTEVLDWLAVRGLKPSVVVTPKPR